MRIILSYVIYQGIHINCVHIFSFFLLSIVHVNCSFNINVLPYASNKLNHMTRRTFKILHNAQNYYVTIRINKLRWMLIENHIGTAFKNPFRINNNLCSQLLTNRNTDSVGPGTPHKFRSPPFSPPSPLTNTLSPLGITDFRIARKRLQTF